MQQPPKTTATGNLLDAGSFTLGCLESNALSMVLIAEFEKQQDLLRATNEALNKAKDFTNRKAGPINQVDELARQMLRLLQLDALKFVGKNTKDPFYIALLGKGLSFSTKLKGEDMNAELGRLAERLKDLPKEHALHGYHAQTVAIRTAYVAPSKVLEDAKTAQAKARTTRDQARLAWLGAYEGVYGGLRKIFPGRKAYVETFFRKFSKGGKGNGNGNGGGGNGGSGQG